MPSTGVVAAVLAAGIAAVAGAQANCPAPGSCFVAHATPGCDNQACCQAVCAIDPFCCATQWDGACANQANQICATTANCQPACNKLNVECLNPGPEYANRTFVAQLRVPPGDQNPNSPQNPDAYCTAWVIAGPDIMFTNNHCGVQVGDIVSFNFECTLCVNGVVKPVTNFKVTAVLACNAAEDWCLFRVNGNVAAQFGQAKIDPSPMTVEQPIYEIHHAEGFVKGYDDGVVTALNQNPNCPGTILEHAVSIIASQGASGSPVFRKDNHCVCAACNCGPACSPGFVLPMSTLWPNLKAVLDAAGGSYQLCGQVTCPPSNHNCFTTGGPGCSNTACCAAVCALDPFCCNNSWDGLCVTQASELCDGCGDPAAGDCCSAHDSPYCNQRTCCDVICAADPFCCSIQWDDICATAAQTSAACNCGPPPCNARIDFGVTPDDAGNPNACVATGPIVIKTQYQITQGIVFGTAVDNFGAPDVGILSDAACDPTCRSSGLPAYATDWWCQFRFADGTKAGVTVFSAELCFIDGPPGTVLMEGYNNNRDLVASASSTVNGTETLSIAAPPGGLIAYVRVAASNPNRPGGISVDCLNYDGPFPRPTCPESSHNCFTTGGPGCTDEECCLTVCAVDDFCCDTAWDTLCVEQASELCDGCGDPASGDCCTVHNGPFCDNRTCCDLVCAIDPFCCESSWDGICVGEAGKFPECGCVVDPCEASDESCFVVHSTPGCDDPECCTIVCANDPFCCENFWDGACKAQANQLCGGCGQPNAGCCFAPHPTPGCNSAPCCRLVCEVDPFCCETAWDSACANQAEVICDGCRADFNGDGVVNGADLGLLLAAWGTPAPCFDLNNDGTVNGADLGLLLAAWGPCVP